MTIIALTGWGQEEDRRKTREAGFDAHLTKPVDHAALLALLAGERPAVAPGDEALAADGVPPAAGGRPVGTTG
jgi:CheY-like chemotaxis protein